MNNTNNKKISHKFNQSTNICKGLYFELTCAIGSDAPGVKARNWLSSANVDTPAIASRGVALVRLECPVGGVALRDVTSEDGGAVLATELIGDGIAGPRWNNTPHTPV